MYTYFFICVYISIASDVEETMHAFLCIRSGGGIFPQSIILNPEMRFELVQIFSLGTKKMPK